MTAYNREEIDAIRDKVESIDEEKVISWAGGFIQADGCFTRGTSRNGRKFPRVCASCADEDTIRDIHKAFEGLGTVRLNKRKEGQKDMWVWAAQSEHEAVEIAKRLYPYVSKRKQGVIEELVELYESRDPHPREKAPKGTKWCPQCEQYKEFSEFSKVDHISSCKYGLMGYCKRCRRYNYRMKYDVHSPEEYKDEIIEMRENGATLKEIGKKLDFHFSTVGKRLQEWGYGQDNYRWGDEELEVLADLDLTYQEVVDKIGRSYHSVVTKAVREGLTR